MKKIISMLTLLFAFDVYALNVVISNVVTSSQSETSRINYTGRAGELVRNRTNYGRPLTIFDGVKEGGYSFEAHDPFYFYKITAGNNSTNNGALLHEVLTKIKNEITNNVVVEVLLTEGIYLVESNLGAIVWGEADPAIYIKNAFPDNRIAAATSSRPIDTINVTGYNNEFTSPQIICYADIFSVTNASSSVDGPDVTFNGIIIGSSDTNVYGNPNAKFGFLNRMTFKNCKIQYFEAAPMDAGYPSGAQKGFYDCTLFTVDLEYKNDSDQAYQTIQFTGCHIAGDCEFGRVGNSYFSQFDSGASQTSRDFTDCYITSTNSNFTGTRVRAGWNVGYYRSTIIDDGILDGNGLRFLIEDCNLHEHQDFNGAADSVIRYTTGLHSNAITDGCTIQFSTSHTDVPIVNQ